MARFDFEAFGEKLKVEIAEQTRTIMREMMVEFRREKKQEPPPPPQLCPFDLDVKTSGKQLIEDDQETLLAEPITRQRLDVPEEIEKPDWAKDLMKTMAQMQIQMKKKGMEGPLDYTDLDLHKGNDPLL